MRTTLAAAILMGSGVRNAEAHGAMNLPRSRNMGESAFKPSAGGGSVNQAGRLRWGVVHVVQSGMVSAFPF
eukprot:COSAG01_NODE_383_length_17798_cov_351.422058_16_plen_71_part_00